MKYNFNLILGLGGFVMGLVGVGYAVGSRKKINNICKRLDVTIDNISKDINVDLPDKIIEEAVDRAVNREARNQVDKAVSSVINTVKSDIHNEVSTAVKAIYPDIRKACTLKVTEEVSKINVKDLKDVIREDAREKVAEKFEGHLDDILEKFNSDLDNISKIYSSITKKITGSDGTNNLKISLS